VVASPPGAYTITPSGLSSSNYSIAYVNGTLTLQPGNDTVARDVLPFINSGVSQLPPPYLSGPLEGGPQALSTNLFSAMQPRNVTGEAQVEGGKPDGGRAPQRLLTGAVKNLVEIVNGGLKVPDTVEVLTLGAVSR
jgi:hypothetical protein